MARGDSQGCTREAVLPVTLFEAPGSGQVGTLGASISLPPVDAASFKSSVRGTVATYRQLRRLYRLPNNYLFKYIKKLIDSICAGLMTD